MNTIKPEITKIGHFVNNNRGSLEPVGWKFSALGFSPVLDFTVPGKIYYGGYTLDELKLILESSLV